MLRAVAIGLLCLLVSCAKYEIEDQSLQFNQAAGSVGNQLLLLNAVRAAKGYPTQFSKLGTYTGQGRVSGKVGAKFPFTLSHYGSGLLARAIHTGNVDSSLDIRSGMQTMQLVDLNTEEAQVKLHKPATDKDLKYYFLQGWHGRLVLTTLIEAIRIPVELAEPIFYRYDDKCEAPRKRETPDKCWAYDELKNLNDGETPCEKAKILNDRHITLIRGVEYFQVRNNPLAQI